MNIHNVLHGSRANGPGLRTVVWFQGCTLGCVGCTNPKTHPHGLGRNIEPDELARELFLKVRPGTEGITFSGGEPMQQASSLYELICSIKAHRPDYSIGLFSGYTASELLTAQYEIQGTPTFTAGQKSILWDRIRRKLDFAILGRFDITRPLPRDTDFSLYPHLQFVSSANQQLVLYTNRYTFDDFGPLKVEFTIGNGLVTVTGFPTVPKERPRQ